MVLDAVPRTWLRSDSFITSCTLTLLLHMLLMKFSWQTLNETPQGSPLGFACHVSCYPLELQTQSV